VAIASAASSLQAAATKALIPNTFQRRVRAPQ
jgi:hypothetical protein